MSSIPFQGTWLQKACVCRSRRLFPCTMWEWQSRLVGPPEDLVFLSMRSRVCISTCCPPLLFASCLLLLLLSIFVSVSGFVYHAWHIGIRLRCSGIQFVIQEVLGKSEKYSYRYATQQMVLDARIASSSSYVLFFLPPLYYFFKIPVVFNSIVSNSAY